MGLEFLFIEISVLHILTLICKKINNEFIQKVIYLVFISNNITNGRIVYCIKLLGLGAWATLCFNPRKGKYLGELFII